MNTENTINWNIADTQYLTMISDSRTLKGIGTMIVKAMAIEIDSNRDKNKIGRMISSAYKAAMLSKYGNTSRCQTITNLIGKLEKMADVGFDDKTLRGRAINALWVMYTHAEMQGSDDAHYMVSDLPCDDRGMISDKESEQGFVNSEYIAANKTDANDFRRLRVEA